VRRSSPVTVAGQRRILTLFACARASYGTARKPGGETIMLGFVTEYAEESQREIYDGLDCMRRLMFLQLRQWKEISYS